MREVFTMWRSTKMVVLAALTAALYAAILIPFKGIPIIPGITEVRPAIVVPVVFGMLFGPAAAWGSGIGNVIGDLFGGTFSLGSFFGFLGNFFFALTAYKLWGTARLSSLPEGNRRYSFRTLPGFVSTVVLASAVCATFVAWGVDMLKMLPFSALGSIIFVNNALGGAILGPLLYWPLRPRVAAWNLLWTDILDPGEVSARPSPRLGAFLMWFGGLGGLGAGLALSVGLGGGQLFQFGAGAASTGVALGVVPFLILYLVGCLLA